MIHVLICVELSMYLYIYRCIYDVRMYVYIQLYIYIDIINYNHCITSTSTMYNIYM